MNIHSNIARSFILLFLLIPIRIVWIVTKLDPVVFHKHKSVLQNRQSIRDRHGRLLATTIETQSIYLDPMKLQEAYYDLIIKNFPIALDKIIKAKDRGSRFLPLERHSKRFSEIRSMKIPGVYFKSDQRRICPIMLSSLIGFCDPYGIGQSGIEYHFNDDLFKKDINLTIDFGIQVIMYNNLRKVITDFDADGGCGIVLDVQTGKILGLVSYPSPENAADTMNYAKRNRCIDPVEPGSVMKLINIAMAIESGMYNPDSLVDSRGPLRIGDFEVNDFFGANKIITLRESLWRSSNIANARVALSIGLKQQKEFLSKLGLLDQLQYINKLICPVIIPKRWNSANVATIAYGYGLSITLLHLAKSIAALVTGYDVELNILDDQLSKCRRVLNKNTVNTVKSMMKDVIIMQHKNTIGKCGVEVGGKTGTANLCINGQYVEGKNLVTIATVFPMQIPKYLVIMQVTDPKKEKLRHGNYTTASNVLSRPMSDLIKQLQVVI